jgi:FecR protein
MAPGHQERGMIDSYLWDGSGQPDPEIQRLELALGRFRHSRPAPVFLVVDAPVRPLGWWSEIAANVWTMRFAGTLLVISALVCGLWLTHSSKAPPVARQSWEVEVTPASQQSHSGDATLGSKITRLKLGEALETDAASKASIAVAEIGRLEVEPMTRLRLLQSGTGRKRIALDRGTIRATIWAPPGQFVVDTPSAVAVDLGCMYTLHIDDSGSGILRTTLGWVGFRRSGHESFIPAGAACATHVQSGPGSPYFEDASDAFRSALAQLDSLDLAPASRRSALEIVLREARTRDAFTLWHLLPRVTSTERSAVYDRLSALVPPPSGVTREAVLHLDVTMLDSWWNAFDLGDISLWRHWEQSWTDREGQRQ